MIALGNALRLRPFRARIPKRASLFASLLTAAFLSGTAWSQSPDPLTIKPDAKQPVTAIAQQPIPLFLADSARPLTPSDKLRAPYPPSKEGCYRLVKRVWEEVPCATPEELKAHPPRTPVNNSIQFPTRPRREHVLRYLGPNTYSWGSLTINLSVLDSSMPYWEEDVPPPTPTGGIPQKTPNSFSIQNNTNVYACTVCGAGVPFAPVPGIAGSGSQAGDQVWVQFIYDQTQSEGVGATPGSVVPGSSSLCVWDIDLSVSNAAARIIAASSGSISAGQWRTGAPAGYGISDPGYEYKCLYPSNYGAVLPLGQVGPAPFPSPIPTALGTAEVLGYVQCPNPDSYTNCTLTTMASIPWTQNPGESEGGSTWWAVTARDYVGLAGNWENVNGSIVGEGGGSEAKFFNFAMQETVRAYTCFIPPTATTLTPQACTPTARNTPPTPPGNPADYSTTGETSNFNYGTGSAFACMGQGCSLTLYASHVFALE